MTTKRTLTPVRLLVVVLLVLVGLTAAYFAFRSTLIADLLEVAAQPDKNDLMAYGATLFQTRGCSGCHSLESSGASGDTGPDLTGISGRYDAEYIRTSLVDPNAVIAATCPEGPCEANIMPQWGSILNAAQIDALTTYLSVQ